MTYLSADPQFTTSLGAAYTTQPADVTLAVQDLRAQANSAGSLQTDSQQEVVVQEAGVIAIQPANPAVIFVPRYDPVTIYAVGFTPIVYGPSFVIGPWLTYGYDWGGWRRLLRRLAWAILFTKAGGGDIAAGVTHPDRWRHDERFGRTPVPSGRGSLLTQPARNCRPRAELPPARGPACGTSSSGQCAQGQRPTNLAAPPDKEPVSSHRNLKIHGYAPVQQKPNTGASSQQKSNTFSQQKTNATNRPATPPKPGPAAKPAGRPPEKKP